MDRWIRPVQVFQYRNKEVNSMPGSEHTNEADDEPPVKVQTLSYGFAIQVGVEQTRINGVGQDINALGPGPGILQETAEQVGDHDRKISLSPDPALNPACQRRTSQSCTESLLLESKRRVHFEDMRNRTSPCQPK